MSATRGSTDHDWVPTRAQVARLEALISSRRLEGAPLARRVRIYSGVIEGGKKYLVALLVRPVWAGDRFDASRRDQAMPESWNVGTYIVPLSRFPSRISVVPETGCDWVRVVFDPASGQLRPSACIS